MGKSSMGPARKEPAKAKSSAPKAAKPIAKSKKNTPGSSQANFQSQASTDYPFREWETKGCKEYERLRKLNRKSITKYQTFLVEKHFPMLMKKAKHDVEMQSKASDARDARKKRRLEENRRRGLASPLSDDEVYRRGGAEVV
jgi:hypothetical protein